MRARSSAPRPDSSIGSPLRRLCMMRRGSGRNPHPQMADRIHITTAIFYCNGTPHVGSAYEALAADVFARYQRRKLRPRKRHVPQRHRRAWRQDSPRRDRRRARAEGLYRQDERAVPRRLRRPQRRATTTGCAPPTRCIEKFVQQMLRRTHAARRHLFQGLRRALLRRLRALLHRKGIAARQRLSRRTTRPVELISEGNYFLQDREISRAGARAHPGAIPISSGPSATATRRSTCSPSR